MIRIKKKKGGKIDNPNGKGYLLTDADITEKLRAKIGNDFFGVFNKDNAPKNFKENTFAVLNLDKASGQGTHWCVLGFKNGKYLYYDPFGASPPKYIKDNFYPLFENTEIHQALDSSACGLYCIKAILELHGK